MILVEDCRHKTCIKALENPSRLQKEERRKETAILLVVDAFNGNGSGRK